MMRATLVILFIGAFVAAVSTAPAKRNDKCKDLVQKLIKRPPPLTARIRSLHGGTRVKYECVKGARLAGPAERQCRKGKWIGNKPFCKLISCGKPRAIPRASYTGTVYTVGSKLFYKCDPGYRVRGRNPRKCRRNGKWTKKPRCELILCPIPSNLRLRNGKIISPDSIKTGLKRNARKLQFPNASSLLFECNKGYDLIGSDTITCLERGWSSYKLPFCKKIGCPNPGHPPNGQRRGSNFSIGATVRFTCQAGLILRGSSTRTCQPNRMWSGSVVVCDDGSSDCPNPGIPVSGRKIGYRYSFGSLVRFECRDGFVLVGSSVRKCELNGTWNGTEAKCMAEFEYMVKDVNKTAFTLKKNLDTMLEYTCSGMNSTCNMTEQDLRARAIDLSEAGGLDVVFVFDASSSIKNDDFQLGLRFAKELVRILGTSWKPGGTHVAAITYGTEAHLEFNLGDAKALTARDVINSIGQIKRGGGGTASKLALDEVIKRVVPFTRAGSQKVLFFITDGHSNIGGSPRKAARFLRDEKNFQIYAVGVGKKVRRRELMEIASEPEDEYVISVRKYKELVDAAKKCVTIKIDYTPCGESQTNHRARIVGGNRAGHGTWPWQAGIYRIDDTGNFALICGGALISREWILTAAHCFYQNNVPDIDVPEIYTIRLGDNHMQIKEPTQQELFATEIFLHPNYKHSPQLENDIALVKLETEVKLGPFVRTICLPKKGEELLKPKKYGIVAGWGYRRELKFGQQPPKARATSKILRHSAFPIQPNNVCARTVFNFNSTVTFCAGDGKGGNDTCKGDSGGSFVREVLREGTYRWVSTGIVSWGEGCGQKDKYGYYTRVGKFIDWIKKTAV